jgi:predicted transcriptional regulator
MRSVKSLVLITMLLATALAFARKRDPLTEAETDQLRQVATEPEKRLKLYIKFTEARLDSIDQARGDAKQAQGRPEKIHDLLEDFTSLVDEINDNLDQYEGHTLDKDQVKQFHKGLKEVIMAEDRFRARLRTLRHDMETDPQTRTESKEYAFALQDAEEALKSSLETAKEYSTEKSEDKPEKKK